LVEQWNTTPRVRPLVERLQELVPVGPVLLTRRVTGIARQDIAVVAVGQQRARVLVNEVGTERHVAAESVLLVVGVGPGDIVSKIARVIGTRERPEGEDISRRLRRLGIVDGLVRCVQCEAASRAQQAVEAEFDAAAYVLSERSERRAPKMLADAAPHARR